MKVYALTTCDGGDNEIFCGVITDLKNLKDPGYYNIYECETDSEFSIQNEYNEVPKQHWKNIDYEYQVRKKNNVDDLLLLRKYLHADIDKHYSHYFGKDMKRITEHLTTYPESIIKVATEYFTNNVSDFTNLNIGVERETHKLSVSFDKIKNNKLQTYKIGINLISK